MDRWKIRRKTMISLPIWLFVLMCVLSAFGILVVFLCILYIVFLILDLTYHERHPSKKESKCPDFIDKE